MTSTHALAGFLLATAHISILKSIFLAILQGITELFPVSSRGHGVIVPHLLHMNVDITSDTYLPFLTLLHVGTAIALFVYFREQWFELLGSVVRWKEPEQRPHRILLWQLVLGTIPAGLLGLLFHHKLQDLFANYKAAAGFLILNGFILFLGEYLRRRRTSRTLAELTTVDAILIGTSQAAALLPGLSRSGATLVGGLTVGLSHEDAARFAFLLATPIIGAAGVLEVPKLLQHDARGDLPAALIGGGVAAVVAYISMAILMRYFRRNDVNALVPFGIYSIAVGLLTFIVP